MTGSFKDQNRLVETDQSLNIQTGNIKSLQNKQETSSSVLHAPIYGVCVQL